jgi:hypothetical protein
VSRRPKRRPTNVGWLYTQEGWLDLEDDTDRVLFRVKQDLARAGYSKSLAKNVTRSALARALEGKWVAGPAPYGYAVGPDERLVPGDPREVETVRWVFDRYVNTADSLGDIARRLNGQGVPPPAAARPRKPGRERRGRGRTGPPVWTRCGVRAVLRQRAYAGDLVWNATSKGKYCRVEGREVKPVRGGGRGDRHERNAPADRVVVEGAHPALVDRGLLEAAARKMADNYRNKTTPIPGGGEWVLSGLLVCGDCGHRMVGNTSTHRRPGGRSYTYRRYLCYANMRFGPGTCRRNQATQEVVLQEVAALLRENFADPGRLRDLKATLEDEAALQGKARDGERAALAARVADLDAALAEGARRLVRIDDDLLPDYQAELRRLRAERDRLAADLAALDEAADAGARRAALVGEALGDLADLEGTIAEATPAEVRDLLAGVVTKITLHFEHGEQLSRGRRRTRFASLEVDFHPEVADYLLGPGNTHSP